VQIAHLAGAGSFDDDVDAALGVFAAAIAHHDTRMANVYFDISIETKKGDQIAARVRQLGLQRILFASDGALPGNSPKEALDKFHKLPFTAEEFRSIESNMTPYLK
jgi:predicted TIM-barrel fold metal-dependent hydrolase